MAGAKGRKKPGFNTDDLMNMLGAMMGSQTYPTNNPIQATGQAVARGTAKALQEGVGEVAGLATPWTGEEIARAHNQGIDRGHLASLALYWAGLKAPGAARTALRAGQRVITSKGVQPPKPGRKQTAAMTGQIQDPLTFYTLLTSLVNRR
jgi:hypothetical protein